MLTAKPVRVLFTYWLNLVGTYLWDTNKWFMFLYMPIRWVIVFWVLHWICLHIFVRYEQVLYLFMESKWVWLCFAYGKMCLFRSIRPFYLIIESKWVWLMCFAIVFCFWQHMVDFALSVYGFGLLIRGCFAIQISDVLQFTKNKQSLKFQHHHLKFRSGNRLQTSAPLKKTNVTLVLKT